MTDGKYIPIVTSSFDDQVIQLIDEVNATGRNNERLDRAFALNNQRWHRETKKWCGGCVNRVFKRLTDHYNYIKTNATT